MNKTCEYTARLIFFASIKIARCMLLE